MERVQGLDWASFEAALVDLVCRALGGLHGASKDDRFYVIALHSVVREADGPIWLPCVAANTVVHAAPDDENGFWGARWNPWDWAFPEIPLSVDEALELQAALTREATRGDPQHWRETWDRYHQLLIRTARQIQAPIRARVPLTDDAVVFWFDKEGGPELARLTISEPLYNRLFQPQVDLERSWTQLAAKHPTAPAAFLVTRFGVYRGITSEMAQQALLRLGAVAIPSLLDVLEDQKVGQIAARVLGQLGYNTTHVVSALRTAVACSLWHAMALGMLGDHEWLRRQAPSIACRGLTARLKAIGYENGGEPPPLDYRPLETWLDGVGSEAIQLAESALRPGQSYIRIVVNDVDEALRGLSSEHAVARWHAASVLGHRGLGGKVGARVLPALSKALEDAHPYVRRLAVLAMGRWKAAAKPYRANIRALVNDPDEVVCRVTKPVLKRL